MVPCLRAENKCVGIILEPGETGRLPDRALTVQGFTQEFTMLFLLASLRQGNTPKGLTEGLLAVPWLGVW